MKRKQFPEEKVISILKQAETGAVVTELCRKHGMSSATGYAWKAKHGGLKVSEAKRRRALEDDKAKLKPLLADAMLDNAGLKNLLAKKVVNARAKRATLAGWVRDEQAARVRSDRGRPDEHALPIVSGR